LKVSLDLVGVDPDPGFDVCVGPNQEPPGSEGTGILSHLGRVQISGTQCDNIVDLEVTDGFGIYVAANGDYIEVEYSGGAVSNPVGPVLDGWGSAEIVGRTGRFEAASGEFDFTFTTFLSDFSTLLDGEGWITYDASNEPASSSREDRPRSPDLPQWETVAEWHFGHGLWAVPTERCGTPPHDQLAGTCAWREGPCGCRHRSPERV
jgi:hypothetical protein